MLGLFSPQIFLGQAQRRLMSQGLPVFTYHKISAAPSASRDRFLYVSPQHFDQQLEALRAAGYESVSLDALASGQQALISKVVITFDDGFRNVFEQGTKILATHQFRAIQFLVAGALGSQNNWDVAKGDLPEPLMDDGQVKEWLSMGHEIGSHSLTHRNLRKLSQAEAREEIFGSKQRLEDKFGIEVRHFCYPFGGYNEAVRNLVREAGFKTASTVLFGVNEPGTSAFDLRRIIPLSSAETLRKILDRLSKKLR